MTCYKLSAEHITRSKAKNIIKQAEDTMNLEVYHAGEDDTFDNFFHMVVEANKKEIDKLRDFVWEQNNGAYCELVKDWTEEMDWDASWL